MSANEILNNLLVKVFNDILSMEEKALIVGKFKDISITDMHIIEAIDTTKLQNMSSIAKKLDITVGTLTIAINNLVKKGYVSRVRSERDRRVVLLSLTQKGKLAFKHHEAFHKRLVDSVESRLEDNETEILIKSLQGISDFCDELK